jgi:glycosyltransferase involved in cell wall biosynthesis
MHCHSLYSERPIHFWIFSKLGARESYTEPETLYRLLKERGMDFVTITDHDRIDGAAELAERYPDAFVSCEFTVRFTGEPAVAHVCAYGLNAEQHRMGCRLARDIREFAEYFREQNVLVSVAHPAHHNNSKLGTRHLEILTLLFENFEETNGLQADTVNQLQTSFLDCLTPELVEDMSRRHGIVPAFDEPWIKGRTAGSDDHTSFFLGRCCTEVPGAAHWREFLQGIHAKRSRAHGRGASALMFAHAAHYTVGRALLGAGRPAADAAPPHELAQRVFGTQTGDVLTALAAQTGETDGESVLQKAARLVLHDWLDQRLRADEVPGRDLQAETFEAVNSLFNTLTSTALRDGVELLGQARIVDGFGKLSLLAPAVIAALPYLLGYRFFHGDRTTCADLAAAYDLPNAGNAPPKWAWFTDTANDVNGVARTIQTMTALADKYNVPITVVTCSARAESLGGRHRRFQPLYRFRLPGYEIMDLTMPPLLEMLRFCEEQRFTRIMLSTPGPVGLAGLLIGRVLHLPTAGIYHTDVPQFARILTSDPQIERVAWSWMRLFYGGLDDVYVLTDAYRQLLAANGIDAARLRLFPKGTDVERFHPRHRRPQVWRRYGLAGKTVVLYVGRVSKEKNLDVLREAFFRVRRQRSDVGLAIVGDGPYLLEFKRSLADTSGVTFTGFVEGEELAELYASADIFAFPSTTDTYGSAVLEAQASGLPAVVSDVGGPPEVIRDGATGYVTRADDAEHFAAALLRLVEDPPLRQRLGLAARRHAATKSWDRAFLALWKGEEPTVASPPAEAAESDDDAEAYFDTTTHEVMSIDAPPDGYGAPM